MIDKKKIEEAAKEHGIKKSNEYSWQLAHEASFKDGIKWLFNNLWHDASEEPKEDIPILIQRPKKSRINMEFLSWSHTSDIPWQEEVLEMKIIRWLYLSDLKKEESNK